VLVPDQPVAPASAVWKHVKVFEILGEHEWIEPEETVSDDLLLNLGIPNQRRRFSRRGWCGGGWYRDGIGVAATSSCWRVKSSYQTQRLGIPGQGNESEKETREWEEEKRCGEKRQSHEDKEETKKWEQGKDKTP
jgi:hypothetical protein